MLVKTAHKNISMTKLNEKHIERRECCTVYSTIDDINLYSTRELSFSGNLVVKSKLPP